MPELHVRLAQPAEVEQVLDLLAEAAQWVRTSTGIEQWPERFPREFIGDLVDKEVVYVALDEWHLVGTLCLQWSDATFWPDADEDAAYVHRLVVRRSYAGRGIGELLLAWAAERAVDAGRVFVRLDCMTENLGLRHYYESLGFRHQGDTSGDNPLSFSATFRPRWYSTLYEKRVSPRAAS